MSYEKQPEPILPNYNPSAWDSPLSAEEQEVLDAYYVKFPIAQNAPITFPNTTTLGTVKTNTIDPTTVGSTLSIADTQTSGVLSIGNQNGSRVGEIRIGKYTKGDIIIADGSTVGANNYIIVGTDAVSKVYLRGSVVNIQDQGASGNVIIGNSANSATITVNRPITIGYSVPTVNTQLGHTSTTAITWSGISNAIVAYSPNLPIGTYIVHICFELNGTFVPSFLYTYSTGAAPISNNSVPFVNGGDRILACGSFIIQLTTAGTFALTNFATNNYLYTSPGATVDGVFVSTGGLYITRIA